MDETQELVASLIRPCRVAIGLNIWSSIFTAAFFAYVKPAGSLDTEVAGVGLVAGGGVRGGGDDGAQGMVVRVVEGTVVR